MSALAPYITNRIIRSNRDLHYFKKEFNDFKQTVSVPVSLENEMIAWLDDVISKRVEALLERHFRNAYYRGVELLLAYGEVLESRDIAGARAGTAKKYRAKYSRFRRFVQELKERL